MDTILQFFKEFNLQNIISMGVIMWYFTRDIKRDICRLTDEMHHMNTRVSRVEGTVYGKQIYEKVDP
jgi:hypothetical protein